MRNLIRQVVGHVGYKWSSLSMYFHEVARAEGDEEQGGQGMVEYALVLVLIAVVVIVILGVLGHKVSNVYSNVSSGLSH